MGNRSISWMSPHGPYSVPRVTALCEAFITPTFLPPNARAERNIMQAESATEFYEKVCRFNMEINFLFTYLYLNLF